MDQGRNRSGFTLLEMLICIFILGMIALGLERVLASALSSQTGVQGKQELLADARAAMERMVMFVQETDKIKTAAGSLLEVRERLLNTYDNETLAYNVEGDGYVDADKNHDGIVTDPDMTSSPDTPEYISFSLENGELKEKTPNYGTADPNDVSERVICRGVTDFQCGLDSSDTVNILLVVDNGKATVQLQTRARARLVE